MTLKRTLTLLSIVGFLLLTSCSNNNNQTHIRACFTPGENCIGDIVETINQTKKTLFIQADDLTSSPIINAIVSAKKRGTDVRIIFDKSIEEPINSFTAASLLQQHIPLWLDNKVESAHNNVMISDDAKVITGGFSFTPEAQEKNAENLLILTNPVIAKRYLDNWQSRVVLSEAVTNVTTVEKDEKHELAHNKHHRLAKRKPKKKYFLAGLFGKK